MDLGYDSFLNANQRGYDALGQVNIMQAQAPTLAQTFMANFRDAQKQRLLEQQQLAQQEHMQFQNMNLAASAQMSNQKYLDDLRKAEDDRLSAEAIGSSLGESGRPDPTRVAVNLAKAGLGRLIPQTIQRLSSDDKTQSETAGKILDNHKKAKAEVIGSLAPFMVQESYDPQAIVSTLQSVKQSNPTVYGTHVDDLINSLPQGITMMDPEKQKDFVKTWLKSRLIGNAGADKLAELLTPKTSITSTPGAVYSAQTNQLTGETSLGAPLVHTPVGQLSTFANALGAFDPKTGKVDRSNPDVAQQIKKENNIQPNATTIMLREMGDPGYDGKTPLDKMNENIAREMARGNFKINDNMRADPAFKKQYTRALQIAAENGWPAPGEQNKDIRSTEKAALADIEKRLASYSVWNNTLGKNIGGMLDAARKIPDFGSRFANRPIREIAAQASDPTLAGFMPFYNAVTREYGKLSGFSQSGVLTDNAVKHAEEVLNKNGTLAEFIAATDAMHKEGANGEAAWKAERDKRVKGIRGIPGASAEDSGGGPSAPPRLPPTKVNPANGKTYYLHPDNNYYLEPPK